MVICFPRIPASRFSSGPAVVSSTPLGCPGRCRRDGPGGHLSNVATKTIGCLLHICCTVDKVCDLAFPFSDWILSVLAGFETNICMSNLTAGVAADRHGPISSKLGSIGQPHPLQGRAQLASKPWALTEGFCWARPAVAGALRQTWTGRHHDDGGASGGGGLGLSLGCRVSFQGIGHGDVLCPGCSPLSCSRALCVPSSLVSQLSHA